MKLWYKKAAAEWVEALPLGNGHMGAMVFGNGEGLIELSENTCWSGCGEIEDFIPEAPARVEKLREHLIKGEHAEAMKYKDGLGGYGNNFGTQVPMGRFYAGFTEPVSCCERSLDIITGVHKDQNTVNGAVITREAFLSNPDRVLCLRFDSDSGELPELNIWIEGYNQPSHTRWQDSRLAVKGRALEIQHSNGVTGVTYAMLLHTDTDGELSWSRKGIHINGSTYMRLYVAAHTDFQGEDALKTCKEILDKAVLKGYDAMKDDHIRDHSSWMNGCLFHLPEAPESQLPTDERIEKYGENQQDQALISLLFQYGRYLLLGTSRPDSALPAALQGIWNDDRACRMGWTDDMHLDINTQMNYYPAENTGLSACTLPLYKWIKEKLMPEGERTAKELYGKPGWTAHIVSNAYGFAGAGLSDGWMHNILYPTGGAWITTHIWEHYLYTGDVDFLEEYYPVLYGCAQFLASILMEEPDTHHLLPVPSFSPENHFYIDGKAAIGMCAGATHDVALVKYMFQCVIEASKLLQKEDDFVAELSRLLPKLPPFQVGKYGQLQEWYYDYEETDPDHRHTSHVLSLHPFNLITPEEEPELSEAVRKTFERRLGDNAEDIIYANWAGALLILQHARLLDGEKAGIFIQPMISYLSRKNLMITHQGPTTSETGGIYELDGNTGFTAGVAEMLLQSYSGNIHVLPAIPSSWSEGSYAGLVAYGGHKVSTAWNEQSVTVTIQSGFSSQIKVRYGDEIRLVEGGTPGTITRLEFTR